MVVAHRKRRGSVLLHIAADQGSFVAHRTLELDLRVLQTVKTFYCWSTCVQNTFSTPPMRVQNLLKLLTPIPSVSNSLLKFFFSRFYAFLKIPHPILFSNLLSITLIGSIVAVLSIISVSSQHISSSIFSFALSSSESLTTCSSHS